MRQKVQDTGLRGVQGKSSAESPAQRGQRGRGTWDPRRGDLEGGIMSAELLMP